MSKSVMVKLYTKTAGCKFANDLTKELFFNSHSTFYQAQPDCMFCLLSIVLLITAEFDRPEEETEVVPLSYKDGWWYPILTFLNIQCSAADWGLWYVPLCSVRLCSVLLEIFVWLWHSCMSL